MNTIRLMLQIRFEAFFDWPIKCFEAFITSSELLSVFCVCVCVFLISRLIAILDSNFILIM